MEYRDLRLRLTREIDDKYRDFVAKGVPTDRPILGVRVPIIRQIASQIPKEDYYKIIKESPVSLEELILRGILIAHLPYEEMLKSFDSQILLISDWCSCDIFCASLRPLIKKHPNDFYEQKIQPLLDSKREFSVRVGLVLLLGYINPDYLAVIYGRLEQLKNSEEYYIKMALAWVLAECFIKFPDETLSYLQVSKLPAWTFNKAISKICDSLRVEENIKAYLKTLRRR